MRTRQSAVRERASALSRSLTRSAPNSCASQAPTQLYTSDDPTTRWAGIVLSIPVLAFYVVANGYMIMKPIESTLDWTVNTEYEVVI